MISIQFSMEFILRQKPTSDELPPWAGISFKYPVDSDDLSEKLRAAYPDCKTHRERKHRAVIDFLSEELCRMQSGVSIADGITLEGSTSPSQLPIMNGSKPVTMEALSDGNDALSVSGYTSPSVIGSLASPIPTERVRKGSRVTTNLEQSQQTASPTSARQFVWNAHDGRSMQQKIKRKMTAEERNAYKETRKRGACDKCRRQKGRVITHQLFEHVLIVKSDFSSVLT
ncbi:hypothetical protein BU23DRAFT_165141 [Bimuria novae-zelandiae CBS 107.79]|uniref:Uncharacterized protein n=1 Tax=Bimuria novae-zelandiae CBS 107.79 TaxID=1447943 RepID=A0A6A5V8B2_9PLEO|nr:hypothetical protein BU23DRAFT_165141 [Bimuria novae-zelandiae CBS 107.79]